MNERDFEEKILELIELNQEGSYWDFKREWYSNKQDMLHDIICMANNLSTHDGYIIIGVDEETNFSFRTVKEDENRRSTQNIVDFLRSKKFAGGIRPMVYVRSMEFGDIAIDVIIIQNDRNTPYYLTENYKGVFANNIYTRVMDNNTPKTSSADISHIEYLWKKRFAIDATAVERVMLYLRKPSDWINAATESKRYHKYFPEFSIENVSARDERDGYEFYLFGQRDSLPRWYEIDIYFQQTLLDSIGGAALDGGRYFTATPQLNGFSLTGRHRWDISYKYFIEDSIEYLTHRFYYTTRMLRLSETV